MKLYIEFQNYLHSQAIHRQFRYIDETFFNISSRKYYLYARQFLHKANSYFAFNGRVVFTG